MGASLRHPQDEGAQARLHLDGLATPILTRVTRHGPTGMTVEQTLPFLRLHTGVRDDADQHARIESVSMVVYEGMPRLVLDLAYSDEAIEPDAEPARAARAGVARPRVREATTPFELETPALEPGEAPAVREPTLAFTTAVARDDEPSHGLSGEQLTLEEQLLLERSFKHQLRTRWTTVEPGVQRFARAAQAGAVLAWGLLWPMLRAGGLHALAALRAGVARVKARRATP